jgi:2-amino-4-hydroxy-6-hydroxymethyldihydropteridine diphosphokinase
VAVAIAVGSNLGNREAHMAFARSRLRAVLRKTQFSSIHETAPVGTPDPQPHFLNAAITGETLLSPRDLVEVLQSIEQARGRERPFQCAARTLDLDLILFGTETLAEARVTVPHPRFRERGFVLRPLSEIAPDWLDPVTGLTVAQLLGQLQRAEAAKDSNAAPDKR